MIAGRQGLTELDNVVEALLYLEESGHSISRDRGSDAVDDIADVLVESTCSARLRKRIPDVWQAKRRWFILGSAGRQTVHTVHETQHDVRREVACALLDGTIKGSLDG